MKEVDGRPPCPAPRCRDRLRALRGRVRALFERAARRRARGRHHRTMGPSIAGCSAMPGRSSTGSAARRARGSRPTSSRTPMTLPNTSCRKPRRGRSVSGPVGDVEPQRRRGQPGGLQRRLPEKPRGQGDGLARRVPQDRRRDRRRRAARWRHVGHFSGVTVGDPHQLPAEAIGALKTSGLDSCADPPGGDGVRGAQLLRKLAAAVYQRQRGRRRQRLDGRDPLARRPRRPVSAAPRGPGQESPDGAVAPSSGGGADRTPPRVAAVKSGGYRRHEHPAVYRVSDNSGRSSDKVGVFAATRLLTKSGCNPFGPANGKALLLRLPGPREHGGDVRVLRPSRDPSGNVSRPSCAPLY